MSNSLCFTRLSSIKLPAKPGFIDVHPSNVVWLKDTIWKCENPKIRLFELKATAPAADNNDKNSKSIFCSNCEGNGAVACSQCKGSGVNSVDYFNGQFKAGASCWLCGGKKDILCGDCNGAGFLGGFMSTFDE
ncbi:protein BUNDLE SHEATH DEFECTIVE 2, chloroplastic-like [Impatiens glandulifera]|uniref:protein BUNDLE SHEATH DEFECTIVE 2, chloroplastic-like n=1 Tax=Impatiens glandulifera TaxID=253017 RepID=UPI001FB05050|nr:protein BUNDLE SHEATH DEFECTIVE 2, chloroplastic-like [Impatiens glandulifera]